MASGMMKIEFPQQHWAVKAARFYSSLTGAGAGFGFFSPNIPRQICVDFDVTTRRGQLLHSTLQETAGSDVNLRIGNMIRMMAKTYKNKKVYRSMAASLTASIYKRYPDAKEVTMHASIYDFPDMLEYRRGERPKRVEIYSAKFGRKL
jgi:hypothetical protein